MAELAQRHNLFYVDNLGGGSLVDLTKRGMPECPTLQQGIIDNAHLVLASGDKIIGGPQAGVIVGKKDCVWNRVSHHVLARTLQASQTDTRGAGGNALHLCRWACLGRNADSATASLPEKSSRTEQRQSEKPYPLPEWRRQLQRVPTECGGAVPARYRVSHVDRPNQAPAID